MKSNIKYFNMKNQGTIKNSICHNQDLNQSIGHSSTFILTLKSGTGVAQKHKTDKTKGFENFLKALFFLGCGGRI